MVTKAITVRRRSRVPRAFRRAFQPRGKPKLTIPLLVVAGFLPAAAATYTVARQEGFSNAGKHFTKIMTGWDGFNNQWQLRQMKAGALPLLIGIVAHKIANRLGLNTILARVGVPYIRL